MRPIANLVGHWTVRWLTTGYLYKYIQVVADVHNYLAWFHIKHDKIAFIRFPLKLSSYKIFQEWLIIYFLCISIPGSRRCLEYVETKDFYIKPWHWVHMWRPLICDLFHHILSNSIAKPLLKLWYGWAITSHITCGCNYLTMPSTLDNENMTAKEGFDIVLRCLLKKNYIIRHSIIA